MDPKILTENGWKATVQKFKVKDNGLQKALATHEKLADEKFDERLKALGTVSQLAATLKKDKAVAAMAPVVKYLTDMAAGVDAARAEITKNKAAAEKTAALAAKKDQDAAKKDQEKEGDEEEEESGDAITKLTTALKTLKTAKQPYFFLVCDVKPYGLLVSKKEIKTNAQAKKDLSQLAGGTTRPPKFGTCHFDSGKLVFDMDKPPSGLARILQKWIKDNTGLGLKVMVGTESGEDEDSAAKEPAESGKEAGGKPEAPGGVVASEKAAKFTKAAESWHGIRKQVDDKVAELKKAILAHYAGGHADLLKEIDKGLGKLDVVLDKLDHRLADSFTKAGAAANEAASQAELKNTKAILAEYIAFVKAEPLIAHADSNPFGVKTNLKQTLIGAVTDAAKIVG